RRRSGSAPRRATSSGSPPTGSTRGVRGTRASGARATCGGPREQSGGVLRGPALRQPETDGRRPEADGRGARHAAKLEQRAVAAGSARLCGGGGRTGGACEREPDRLHADAVVVGADERDLDERPRPPWHEGK